MQTKIIYKPLKPFITHGVNTYNVIYLDSDKCLFFYEDYQYLKQKQFEEHKKKQIEEHKRKQIQNDYKEHIKKHIQNNLKNIKRNK